MPSIRESLKMKIKPIVWNVEKLIPTEGITLIMGEPGCGKTWLALDVAVHMSQGRSMYNRSCLKKNVLFIAAEGGSNRMCDRVNRMFSGVVKEEDFEDSLFWEAMILKLDLEEDLQVLRTMIEKNNIGMCILDPFVRLLGDTDENNNTSVAKIFASLYEISLKYGCDFILLHHTGKGVQRGPYGARGAGVIASEANSILSLVKTREGFTVYQKKNRDDEEQEKFNLVFVDGVDKKSIELKLKETKSIENQKDEFYVLKENKGTMYYKDVASILNKKEDTTRKALNRLADSGLITKIKDGYYEI